MSTSTYILMHLPHFQLWKVFQQWIHEFLWFFQKLIEKLKKNLQEKIKRKEIDLKILHDLKFK